MPSGKKGSIYETYWQPITMKKICQDLGIYILNGLSPLPYVKWKLKPQSACKTHICGYVYNTFGPNATQ